jgi:ATP-dependent DNA helicase RecG
VHGETLTKAGLILVGKPDAIRQCFPAYRYSYLLMERSGSDYSDRIDGDDCIAIAVERIEGRIGSHNQLTTMKQGLLHFEYRTYPEIAIREALLNAFVHADYRIPGLIQIKQFNDRLEIANPGGLIGGVAPDNILRHVPVARNTALANALIPLRLVNRSNVGVHRMYEAVLQEGKEPPIIQDSGDQVRVTFLRSDFSFAFRAFVADAAAKGDILSLEELLVCSISCGTERSKKQRRRIFASKP